MVLIRPETANEGSEIYTVNAIAFGRPQEAVLVDVLRESNALSVSLVAVVNSEIVGHIAFSPVTLDSESTAAAALAPLAVLPAYQRKGIGLQLVQAGLQACREAGFEVVIVLGHPEYYPKAGFQKASPYGIYCEFDVPEEAFMVLELKEGALMGYQGTVHYHSAFYEVD